ncbi:hypothetical protein E2562_004151 [Oryza meyeriana var. granulata]|uniref:Uncharacterized protein n=1 Tax=Oryza meyeriana var. granulata TaxID=110450 RepID=A0A6G1BT71_9ORYZ|nr:hypothetical protein E2562_004151 [Oryza meyeriana var. granulata]
MSTQPLPTEALSHAGQRAQPHRRRLAAQVDRRRCLEAAAHREAGGAEAEAGGASGLGQRRADGLLAGRQEAPKRAGRAAVMCQGRCRSDTSGGAEADRRRVGRPEDGGE